MSLNQVPKVTIIPECKGAGKTPLIISVLVELSGEHLCFPEAGRSLVGLVYYFIVIGGAMFLNGWRHVSVADSEAVNCQVISVFDTNLDIRYFTDGHMYYICVGIFLLKYYSISQWFH
ncbi:hypothetical protein SDC9_31877 [bioreactor metagenome]|jgi:hypothetical protein|uniref:Uncharacterized protein n=1 Tax=bioreactor metagenome TaxID=1076179 RepID=A0A644V516_9ZZZZ